jgi:hypothetical protein
MIITSNPPTSLPPKTRAGEYAVGRNIGLERVNMGKSGQIK